MRRNTSHLSLKLIFITLTTSSICTLKPHGIAILTNLAALRQAQIDLKQIFRSDKYAGRISKNHIYKFSWSYKQQAYTTFQTIF